MNRTLIRVKDGYTYAGDTDLKILTCPCCGVTYAIPLRLQENAFNKGEFKIMWHCPNGHELGYEGKGEDEKRIERAEKQAKYAADRAARLASELEQERAHARAQKGRATRFKNDRDRERKRTAAGVCPCCNRSFQNLARHMKGQHPEFPEADADG